MHPGLGDTRLLHWITCAVFKVRRVGAPGLGLRPGRSLKTQQHARALHRPASPEGDPVGPACARFQFRSTFQEPLEFDRRGMHRTLQAAAPILELP